MPIRVDNEDDRPRKKRPRVFSDDDEDDDRPRKKSKKKKGVPVWVFAAVGGGVLFVLLGLGVAYIVGGGKGGGLVGVSAPAGYSTVGESSVGIKLALPGNMKGQFVRKGGPDGPPDPNYYTAFGMGSEPNAQMCAFRRPGFTPGTSEAQLVETYASAAFVNRPNKYDITSKKSVTLGGRPGMELHIREKPDIWDRDPQQAEFFKDKNQEETARVAREGKYIVALVLTNGEWTYVITIEGKGKDPDSEVVKTVIDSIRIL